jgi:hypothetical protein
VSHFAPKGQDSSHRCSSGERDDGLVEDDPEPVFKFFLVGFLTAVPNWTVGETFLMAHGRRLRLLEIGTELLREMLGRSQGAQQ